MLRVAFGNDNNTAILGRAEIVDHEIAVLLNTTCLAVEAARAVEDNARLLFLAATVAANYLVLTNQVKDFFPEFADLPDRVQRFEVARALAQSVVEQAST